MQSVVDGNLVNPNVTSEANASFDMQPMVSGVLVCGATVIGALLTVFIVAPWMVLLFIPLIPAYEWVRRRFVAAAREVKRLDSVAASPIFSHFGETLQVNFLSHAAWLTGQ